MATGTVVLILAAIAVIFGVMKKHNHGWVAFAAIVLGISLMHSFAAAPANALLTALVSFIRSVLRAFGLPV
ncbi:MAG: hypothetical protein ACRDRL_08860 [Sciscionella sp.]